ncbi:hypothetical protein K449DRAFT_428476 [Hypoxylon sp. EC38]|nr:hypothetical protein K449DRAFT_428476 [Hypoxylon sp. EC38]
MSVFQKQSASVGSSICRTDLDHLVMMITCRDEEQPGNQQQRLLLGPILAPYPRVLELPPPFVGLPTPRQLQCVSFTNVNCFPMVGAETMRLARREVMELPPQASLCRGICYAPTKGRSFRMRHDA